ncbi:Neuropeptide FF receptor 2 [Trichoplax sp. H2]|nr:Neuropeptide FF receptor 2 [Trichoplax sp. H2]|eukprot:RDD37901.1 Neuropeptide FF receptor 2 [Trichoplax sp. H2]
MNLTLSDDNYSFINKTMKKKIDSSLARLIATISISIFGLMANGIISYSIFKKRSLHLPTYILISNMCVSDIITLISVAVNTAVDNILAIKGTNILSFDIACKLLVYILATSFTVSTFSLATIAIDRYCIVTHERIKQMLFLKTKWKLRITIPSLWLVSCIINSPILWLIYVSPTIPSQCDFNQHRKLHNIIYFSLLFLIIYILPLAVVVVVYLKLGLFLRSALISRNKNDMNRYRQFKLNQKRGQSMIKMMTAVTIVYMFISVPFVVIVLTTTYYGTTLSSITNSSPTALILVSTGFALSTFSCVINPIIYLKYNETLRKALPSWLRCGHRYKRIRVAPIL